MLSNFWWQFERRKEDYMIFTCSKCLRPSSSSGSVETLPIPGAPAPGVSTGRRAGLGLGRGGGIMRRGEAASEGIWDRGCWTSETISRREKDGDRWKPFQYREAHEGEVCIVTLSSLLTGLGRTVSCVTNTAATSGEVQDFSLVTTVPPQSGKMEGLTGFQKGLLWCLPVSLEHLPNSYGSTS